MQIKPTGHHVLIKLREVERKSSGGILLAESTHKKEQAGGQFAEIIDVGPTAWAEYEEPWAKIGDTVITVRYAGAQFDYDDEQYKLYRIINDDEIISVVNK